MTPDTGQLARLREMTDLMAETYREYGGIPADLAVNVEVVVYPDGGIGLALTPEYPCGAPLRRFGGELPARPVAVEPGAFLAPDPSGDPRKRLVVDPTTSTVTAVEIED